MKKLVTYLCFTLILPTSLFADFGDNPIQWSTTESADFQDFAIRTFNRSGTIVNSYWPHFWLNQTLLTLNLASPKKIDHTIPLILKQSSINAFAIPGNVIGIHTGLWRFADNESELISVLAHETSHIALDHFSRLSKNSNQHSLAVASGILLTILLAQNNPEVANAALLSTIATVEQNRLNFSRAMEIEADQLAQAIMENTRFDTEAGRVFFQKLDSNSAIDSAYEFLLTHPLGDTRSSKLSSANQQQSPSGNANFYRFLTTYLLSNKINTSIKLNELDADSDPNIAFALVLQAYEKSKNSDQYLANLSELIELNPQFLPAKYEKLRIQVENQDENLCKSFHRLQNDSQNIFLTLNVLEDIKKAAELCKHRSSDYWHAQLLWQSGRETQALGFLTKSLRNETDTNQVARLKQLLDQFNSRYERFN